MRLTKTLVRGGPTTQPAIWLLRRAHTTYKALAVDERREVRTLLSKSRGRPTNLSSAERVRLRGLARKAVRPAHSG